MRVLPATMAIGTFGVLGAAALAPGALIHVVAALKIGEGALRYSLDQGTRELLYIPVAQEIRPRVKTTIDVLLQRVARATAAVLLFTVSFGWVTPIGISWIVLALIVVWIGITYRARRNYVAAFREGLLERRIDADERLDPSDASTLETLVASLSSDDATKVLHGIDLLAAQGRGDLVTPLLLHHESPEVRRRTLEVRALARSALRALQGRRTDRRLRPGGAGGGDPHLHRALGRRRRHAAHHQAPRRRPARARRRDRRTAAARRRSGEPRGGGVARRPPHRRRSGRAPGGGADAGRRSERSPRPTGDGPPLANRMLRLLTDPEPEVVRAAVRAVRRWNEREGTTFLFVPILISLLRERRLKHDAREALIACGEEVLPLLVHFLGDRNENFWVRLALPKTISRFRAEAARDALLGALPADETALEHAIISALSSLRAREPALRFPMETIEELVREQARRYLRAFARLDELADARRLRDAGHPGELARAAASPPARGAPHRPPQRSRRQHLRPAVAGASPPRDLAGVRPAQERRRPHAQPRARVPGQHAAPGRCAAT